MELGICEIFHPNIHGISVNSNNSINNHFLVNTFLDLDEFYNNDYKEYLSNLSGNYNNILSNITPHPRIRNFENIYNKYFILHIFKPITLDSSEEIAIIKTIWLKVIQRKYKKYFNKKISQRKSLFYLNYRKLYGHWPS